MCGDFLGKWNGVINKQMEKLINNAGFYTRTKKNISLFKRNSINGENLCKAAVAITIVDYRREGNLGGLQSAPDESAAIILTRRAGRLRNHAGQWAFPGGHIDRGETPEMTAIRELKEEVALSLDKSRVIGSLDDYVTRSGYHITPVVIWGGETVSLKANSLEVASIHRIPCGELLRGDSPIFENGLEVDGPVLYMPIGNTCIAAPTAAMLYQFREVVLHGNTTRVAHYDQPYFAWR